MNDNKINLEKKEENNDEILLNKENISINIDDLVRSEDCIECVLNEFQNKFKSSPKEKNIILKQNEIKFKKENFSSLLTPKQSISEIKEDERIAFPTAERYIYDPQFESNIFNLSISKQIILK